jgi:hypothetical protein
MKMKKALVFSLTILMLLAIARYVGVRTQAKAQETMTQVIIAQVKISFNGQQVIVEIFDNPAGRDFLSLPPFTGSFEDFAVSEKISYLPRKLSTSGSPNARQAQGDFTYTRLGEIWPYFIRASAATTASMFWGASSPAKRNSEASSRASPPPSKSLTKRSSWL